MKCDSYSCKGESHIVSGKPCQDSSDHYSDEKTGVYIAIVCDGHGGDRYFRSDQGSRFLCHITKDTLVKFAEIISKRNRKSESPLFIGKPFTQVPTLSESNDELPRQSEEDKAIIQMFSSIVTQWRIEISKHADTFPITDWESKNVRPEYLSDFQNRKQLEKVYGSTVMACLITKDYWLAFHLGDGKCIMFDDSDKYIQPVLWDEKCFLNRTTSICDPAPTDELRYTYQGDGIFPVAIFLGSDGIDDSYGDGDGLHNFYLTILRGLLKEGPNAIHDSLVESLPIISKRGSQDDMSVAFIYNEKIFREHVLNLTRAQITEFEGQLLEKEKEIKVQKSTIDEMAGQYERERSCLSIGDTSSREYKACEKLRINLKYAQADYQTLVANRDALVKQIKSLYEYLGESSKNYAFEEPPKNFFQWIGSLISGEYGKRCDAEKTAEYRPYFSEEKAIQELDEAERQLKVLMSNSEANRIKKDGIDNE